MTKSRKLNFLMLFLSYSSRSLSYNLIHINGYSYRDQQYPISLQILSSLISSIKVLRNFSVFRSTKSTHLSLSGRGSHNDSNLNVISCYTGEKIILILYYLLHFK